MLIKRVIYIPMKQPHSFQSNLMQHNMTGNTMEHGDWKLQMDLAASYRESINSTVGCCPINLASLTHFLMNGFSHHYHLDESTSIFRGFRCDFKFLFRFSLKFL